MNEKQFVVETVEITDCDTDVSRIAKVITDTKETYSYEDLDEIVHKLNEQQANIEQKDKQLERLYNYFQDYLKDEMSGNAFSEMWDFVKEDEKWEDE